MSVVGVKQCRKGRQWAIDRATSDNGKGVLWVWRGDKWAIDKTAIDRGGAKVLHFTFSTKINELPDLLVSCAPLTTVHHCSTMQRFPTVTHSISDRRSATESSSCDVEPCSPAWYERMWHLVVCVQLRSISGTVALSPHRSSVPAALMKWPSGWWSCTAADGVLQYTLHWSGQCRRTVIHWWVMYLKLLVSVTVLNVQLG